MKTHKSKYRVYWEDTDGGGVVYYANYLKFAERARTDMLRAAGVNQSELARDKMFFVVRHFECDLKKPARLDDEISIETKITEVGGASLTMHQVISCNKEELVDLKILIACVKDFKPSKIPEVVKSLLTSRT